MTQDDQSNMLRVVAVLTCFNRRSTTLRCLRSLDAAASKVDLAVIVFDDCSSDGTAAAIASEHPATTVMHGDGSQYWCGGMRQAMRAAMSMPLDYLLWLNDDVELKPGFLDDLLAAHQRVAADMPAVNHVIVGPVEDPQTGALTYSGFRRRSRWHPAKLDQVVPRDGALISCDTMNGNCILLPVDVVRRVGEIEERYSQQLGDIDYGYRCVQSGARLWVAPTTVGTCALNQKHLRWSNPNLSLKERLGILNTPHGLPVRPWFTFMWRFGGPVAVVLLGLGYLKSLSLSALNYSR